MKHLKIFTIMLLIGLSVSQASFGQINELRIVPSNPTIDDSIQLIVYNTFPTTGCDLENHSIDIQSKNIHFDLNYRIGFLFAMCNSIDTFTIGKLSAGNYKLVVNVQSAYYHIVSYTDSITFTVVTALSVPENELEKNIKIYPNPFVDEIEIQTNLNSFKIDIYSTLGALVKQIPLDFNRRINLSDLKNGIYFIVIRDETGNQITHSIVKNTP